MSISVFDLFTIGIGPSSSHTVGPMRAAYRFIQQFVKANTLTQIARVQVDLFGSLALTGKGHGTDRAVLLGLEGQTPEGVDPDRVVPRFTEIVEGQQINLNGSQIISFNAKTDLLFHYRESLPHHSNGVRFTAFTQDGKTLAAEVYYSIGGGFILTEQEIVKNDLHGSDDNRPYAFSSAAQLLQLCHDHQMTIPQVMMENEKTWRPETEIRAKLLNISTVMDECIDRGCQHSGTLPGGLNVRRRAPELYKKLSALPQTNVSNFSTTMNWLNLYALAVNEENAAGSRVVTAPTNGAAGIVPAVLRYYKDFCENPTEEGIITYLLTAGAIAILYKKGASISAAEVGCQGEVGVACSMAAGALTAALGGSLGQIEKAAEIGMEHHLGLTCDPIGGLVQIPCIERNAMGTVKAVDIAHLVLMEDEEAHNVSLDHVIATMLQTGKDMMTIYKETSTGGLAVNKPEC